MSYTQDYLNDDFFISDMIQNFSQGKNLALVSDHLLLHDNVEVSIKRYQKLAPLKLGGEHFSISREIISGKILGFIHLDTSLDTHELPTEAEAKSVALNFLQKFAEDMVESHEVRWIRPLLREPQNPPHDEAFKISAGESNPVLITGVRVKIFDNKTQKFAWVIVGKNKKIVSFERDIVWDYKNKCRQTEKWLHDSYFEKFKPKT